MRALGGAAAATLALAVLSAAPKEFDRLALVVATCGMDEALLASARVLVEAMAGLCCSSLRVESVCA